jgi:hypothetical protein
METEHLGYKINYDEERNFWQCWDLQFTSPSLKGLKLKIGQHDADSRRVDKFKAVMLESWRETVEPVVVTLIADDKECWVIKPKGRSKEKYETLMVDSADTRAKIAEWKTLREAVKVAEKAAADKLASIPRLSRKLLTEAKIAKAEEAA